MNPKCLFVLCLFSFHLQMEGQISFQKTYGTEGLETGYAVKQCNDGGYIITGVSVPYTYLVRTDMNGDTMWTRRFGGDESGGFDVIQSADGNFVMSGFSGYSDPHMLLSKVNYEGKLMWSKTTCEYWAQALQQTGDNGFILAGDGIQKADEQGETVWCAQLEQQGMYVIESADSNYLVCGSDYDSDSILLQKIDESGQLRWRKSFYGQFVSTSNNLLAQTKNGDIILTIPQFGNSILVKTDAFGNVMWVDTLYDFYSTSLVQTRSGCYAIGGFKNESCGLTLIKTDSLGSMIWRHQFCSPDPHYDIFDFAQIKSVQEAMDGGFILAGLCGSTNQSMEMLLIKTDSLGVVLSTGVSDLTVNQKIIISPNPWSFSTTIEFPENVYDAELLLYNQVGSLVRNVSHISGKQVSIQRGSLAAGIYFLMINDNSHRTFATKMVIVDP